VGPFPIRTAFVASIFLGSFLLFLVQPLITRMLLPAFGGSPAVWNTALVFFQSVLVMGYLYAHALARIRKAGVRLGVHLAVLASPLLVLPPAVPWGLEPSSASWPAFTLLVALSASVGLPFFVLATNSSLVQHWWAGTRAQGSDDPYRLYGASNLGSLLALLAYPFVLERTLPVEGQAALWTGGYLAFLPITIGVMLLGNRAGSERGGQGEVKGRGLDPTPSLPKGREAIPHSFPGPGRSALWLIRAAVASSLLLSVTMRITADVASVPLFWVVPLAAYLLTFIVAFGYPDRFRREGVVGSTALGVGVSLALLVTPVAFPLAAVVGTSLWTLFFGALLCHRDLAADRPPPEHLTAFYLWISVGGAVGGILNTLVAPLVFDSVAEFPLTLMALALLLHADPQAPRGILLRPIPPRGALLAGGGMAAPLLAGFAPSGIALGVWVGGATLLALAFRAHSPLLTAAVVLLGGIHLTGGLERTPVLAQERSFFGVLRVQIRDGELQMIHGTTVHGTQNLSPELRDIPGSYYHPTGPMARAVLARGPGERIGVVGLGAGALAVHTRPGQELVYHEIDAAVEPMARAHFSFLDESAARVQVILGDGRITMAAVPEEHYDVVLVDAFSSSAIPSHLLTLEALDLFLSRVRPGGILYLHISNRHADLRRVVRGYAEHRGIPMAFASHTPSPEARAEGASSSLVAALARESATIGELTRGSEWTRFHPDVRPLLWTDARTDLLAVLR